MPAQKKRKPKPLPRSLKADGALTVLKPKRARGDADLVDSVRRHLLLRRQDDQRDRTGIHVSEISKDKWCPRQTYYRLLLGDPEPDKLNSQSELIFAEGHNIHNKWQTWLWEMGVLRGVFKCLMCGWKDWAIAPQRCPRCMARALDHHGPRFLRFVEVPVRRDDHRIIGHADGDLVGNGFDGLLEVKSMSPGSVRIELPHLHAKYQKGELSDAQLWSSIGNPFPSHVRQGLFYGWMADRPKIYFLYEWKTYQWAKCFTVERNDDLIARRAGLCLDIVHALDNDGRPPARPQFAEQSKDPCKSCPYNEQCWSTR